jgi:hypothetical protein
LKWKYTGETSEDWEDDEWQAVKMLWMGVGCGKRQLVYEKACEDAASFVEREWRVIDAVARRLLEVGYLTGDQVAHLMESVDQEERQ